MLEGLLLDLEFEYEDRLLIESELSKKHRVNLELRGALRVKISSGQRKQGVLNV